MQTLRKIYQSTLTETPKTGSEKLYSGYNTSHGWVFLSNDCINYKSTRTYSTLFALSEHYIYYTPNSFYRSDQRHEGSLRWINAMVIDVDKKNGQNDGLFFPDLIDRISSAGLPDPSIVIHTPSGGFQLTYYLATPKRGTPKVSKLYSDIQRRIAMAIGGDLQAIGAERWFRLPKNENIIYQSENQVSFEDLYDWLTIQNSFDQVKHSPGSIVFESGNLLSHSAILELLNGVNEGKRDNTCYTLALTFKAEGYAEEEAEAALHTWNQKNDPPMRTIDIKRKVKSAYKPSAPAGPSASWIRTLSGLPFTYKKLEGSKRRNERVYSHQNEWKDDILKFLRKSGGTIKGSQREIASQIVSSADRHKNLSYSSFKIIIRSLIEEGLINKTVEGKGRYAVTTISLKVPINIIPFKRKAKLSNGPNSYTLIDQVVGGLWQSCVSGTRFILDRAPP